MSAPRRLAHVRDHRDGGRLRCGCLAARYGDADGYRKQFEARLDELVAEGWLLPDDVAYMRDDFAKVSDF